ncbi:MAG: hypothetical protein GY832_03880 [Chloroflexi bacterium]|nr:hypothetical protein [Chloroflexota bacterium]
MKYGELETVSIVMHVELARKLRILAAIEDKSRSRLVREILVAHLKDNDHITDGLLEYYKSPS